MCFASNTNITQLHHPSETCFYSFAPAHFRVNRPTHPDIASTVLLFLARAVENQTGLLAKRDFSFVILFYMGKTHKEQLALASEIEAAKTKVTIGAEYWHYKGRDKVYKVIGLGFLEANDELCVIYQAQYGKKLTFLRPLDIWQELVEWEGKTVPRFTKI